MSVYLTKFLGFCLLVLLPLGCSKREDLAARLAEEKRIAEQKTPPSTSDFREAAMRGDREAVLQAIERGVDVNAPDEENRTALQMASFDGHTEVVDLLIDRGALVNHLDSKGRTALMFAATGPHADTVDLLITAGAELDLVDSEEHFTALMFAAAEGQLAIVEALLRAGANPDLRDVDNDSALNFAAQNGHAEVVSLLQSVVEQAP
jgi:ankyrin repeat protein